MYIYNGKKKRWINCVFMMLEKKERRKNGCCVFQIDNLVAVGATGK